VSRKRAIQDSINKIKNRRSNLLSPEALSKRIINGDIQSLAHAITLIESTNINNRTQGLSTLDHCMPFTGNALRVGITGVPGVGKSTFIETLGLLLIEQGHKVAVLAIDPSSKQTKGSILGDKTRMETLSNHKHAFIRPSPAGDALGGVATKTRESIFFCEAAGFDIILVETVGVGQSETLVHSMTDFFLLLMLAGAGDELQGIKRGIMEMADQIVINKADGDNIIQAKKARSAYAHALHLFPPKESNWTTVVNTTSGLNNIGVKEAWAHIKSFHSDYKAYIEINRQKQNINWFKEALQFNLLESFLSTPRMEKRIIAMEEKVKTGLINPHSASKEIIASIGKN